MLRAGELGRSLSAPKKAGGPAFLRVSGACKSTLDEAHEAAGEESHWLDVACLAAKLIVRWADEASFDVEEVDVTFLS